MSNTKKIYPNPKFKSLEEEERYWQTHDPIAEGYDGKLHEASPARGRRSILGIRLSGKEIDQLRKRAEKQGLNLSTFVRMLLSRGMKEEKATARPITTKDLADIFKKVRIVKVVGSEKMPEKRRKVVAGR